MNRDETGGSAEASKLFRVIVLMGGSLGLSCGGKTDVVDHDGDTSTTGDATGGAASASGGSPSGGSAAGGNSTGGALEGAGGAQQGSGGAPPSACAAAQWDCSEPEVKWTSGEGAADVSCLYIMPEGCVCDPSRPATPSDCPTGTVRACLAVGYDEAGNPLEDVAPINCECVPFDPVLDTHCNVACAARKFDPRPGAYDCSFVQLNTDVLCGCELAILR